MNLSPNKRALKPRRDGADHIVFPAAFLEHARDPNSTAARTMIAEQKLFELRKQARDGKRAQLTERIAQLKEEMQGYVGQTNAKEREVALINKELEGVRELRNQNLVPDQQDDGFGTRRSSN